MDKLQVDSPKHQRHQSMIGQVARASYEKMTRNAYVIALVIAGSTFFIALFALLSALRLNEWQHFVAFAATFILSLTSLFSAWFSRRGHPVSAIVILLITLEISLLVIANVIEGMAVLLAVGGLGATLTIASLTFGLAKAPGMSVSNDLVNWALIGGVVAAVAISWADVYTPLERLSAPPLMQTSVPFLVGIVLLILMAFVIQQFKGYSLRTKLLITFVFLSLMAVAGEVVFYSASTQSILTQRAQEGLMNTASQTATGLEAFVQQNLDILAAEAKLPVFSRYLRNVEHAPLGTDATNELANAVDSGATQERVVSVLESLSSRDPVYILSYALLDRNGKNLADSAVPSITVGVGDVTPLIQNESGREYFEHVLETGASYVSSVRFYPEGLAQAPEGSTPMPKDARPSLYFSSPVKDIAGEVLGVLRIRYDAAVLQQLIIARNGLAGEESFAMLVDENNLILAHGDEPNWLYKSITPPIPEQLQAFQEAGMFPSEDSAIALTEEEWESLSDLSDELRKVDDSAVFVAETHTHKGEHLEQAAAVKLTVLPWFVVFAQPQEIFLQPIDRQRNRAIFVAFIIAAIATGLAYVGARFLSAPLIQLTTIAENVAAGDLGVTVPENVMTLTDEIGVLASTFNTMTERLRRIWSQLEGRVASRTRALEQRSRYLEASAEVGRVVTSILEPEQLIKEVVGLIRDRFDLYYVGLFLVDSRRQWAELRAGTGEAGRAMLARRHRLPVDESESMVGWTIVHGEARVAQDIDLDDVQRATPELPDTRAEAALPLRARGEVLGALTVQSREYGIFDQDVLRVLQIMADQVAAALDNAQLYAQSQAALEMSSRVYGELNRQAWEDILRFRPEIKVRSDRYGVSMLSDDDGDGDGADAAEAVAEPHGEAPPSEEHHRPLSVSIEGRGGVIGALETYKVGQDEDWTPEEVAMLEEIADRVGQALDSARLYRDSQQSAIREQLTTEITARIREEVEVEAILQRALEELGRELGAKRATVQLEVQE